MKIKHYIFYINVEFFENFRLEKAKSAVLLLFYGDFVTSNSAFLSVLRRFTRVFELKDAFGYQI